VDPRMHAASVEVLRRQLEELVTQLREYEKDSRS
jgi:hypothetical protein